MAVPNSQTIQAEIEALEAQIDYWLRRADRSSVNRESASEAFYYAIGARAALNWVLVLRVASPAARAGDMFRTAGVTLPQSPEGAGDGGTK